MIKILLFSGILLILFEGSIAQNSNLPDLIPPRSVTAPVLMKPYADKHRLNLDSMRDVQDASYKNAAKEFTDWVNSSNKANSEDNGTSSSEVRKNQNDSVNGSLTSGPASNDVKYQAKSFDWEKSNANRYINSPCYKTLGFNPDGGEEQEKRYRECEESKLHRNDTQWFFMIIGLVVLLIMLVLLDKKYFQKKSSIKPVKRNDTSSETGFAAPGSESFVSNNNVGNGDDLDINYGDEGKELSSELTRSQKSKRDILATSVFGVQSTNQGLVELMEFAKQNKKRISISHLTPYIFNQNSEDRVAFNPQHIQIDFSKQEVTLSSEICMVLGCDPTVLVNSYEKANDVEVINLSPKNHITIVNASIMYSDNKIIVVEVDFGMFVKFDNKNTWKLELT